LARSWTGDERKRLKQAGLDSLCPTHSRKLSGNETSNKELEISAKPIIRRSGVSAERRKLLEIEECGFLPKAATPVLQRSQLRRLWD
jgi:hypothetical protein